MNSGEFRIRSVLPVFAALLTVAVLSFFQTAVQAKKPAAQMPPNVLIISIDDLNDWVGCLDGHPNALTPNIDALAKRGTLFTNAHCQAPICTPSRASLVTGKYPSTTGLYFLQPSLAASKVATSKPNLIATFDEAGYHTMGAGKFVHGNKEEKYFNEHGGGLGGFGPVPKKKFQLPETMPFWDWGPFPKDDAEMPDTKVADWVISQLQKEQSHPFFLVAGFWRPHVPLFAPPKWFEKFPLDEIELPKTLDSDRDDLSEYARDLTIGLPAPRHEWFLKNKQWKHAVQSYLASVAFADHCVGRVVHALDQSPYADNTIIVLFSDHGWHLGEKQRWAKRSLWRDSTRVPLIVCAPNTPRDQKSPRPVGLIDIFPTLNELASMPKRDDLEGRSLVPLLQSPNAHWNRPILTTFGPRNHSLYSTDFHFIQYADGTEELYDLDADPHEWHNVASKLEHSQRLAEFRAALPTQNAAPVLSNWRRWEIEAWRNAEKNAAARPTDPLLKAN